MATFRSNEELRVADLSAGYEQGNPAPTEDLSYFFNGITLARDEAVYATAQRIVSEIKKARNVDGFVANSFFTNVAQEPAGQNYCFFGECVDQQRLVLTSLNRLHLKTVSYDFIFGPSFPTAGSAVGETNGTP